MQRFLLTLIAAAILSATVAFSPVRFSSKASTTRVYEDFDTNWKSPTIVSDKNIFSEKQLREFTSTYSVDYRMNPLEFITGLFSGGGNEAPKEEMTGKSKLSSALKKSISLQLLQSKTADYVKGKVKATEFKAVLKAAFGDRLPEVIEEINANLPANKKI
jgi:hypothetical protein